ncbi:metallophosphoesterase [Flavobacterium zepuense]|uniref:Metallophosphoesterase n=1 Tax=Flavobacterium zepuense TaxID=2593302 RepID=A0A552V9L4_9FLAO|nr:metallophosphoesterase [Flavobacterium zepuense]TRW27158.1 metallophosphoesterase [Flavobacterium zepuense]
MKKIVLLVSFCFVLESCDLFEYSPYDGKITGERNINSKNISRIEESCEGKKVIRFAFISDTQRWYDETQACVQSINNRDDLDFVIHGGDLTDFGATNEFKWQRDILNALTIPYVALLGNHDCLANGQQVFESIFGSSNFSFLAGNMKFVCLNTNALEYDYSQAVPDYQYIENELNDSRSQYEKTVVAMHARPFSEQFNNNTSGLFQYYTKQFRGMQFCLNGHEHQLHQVDLFNDGIVYYGVSNIDKHRYYIFTITNESYNYEVVSF